LEIEKPHLQIKGEKGERTLVLDGSGSWAIGRSAENVFVFDDDAMSRRHALLQQMQPGKFYLIDLGSSNGSSVNGQRVTSSVELHDGDAIICGKTTLAFHQPMNALEAAGDYRATNILYQKRLITVLVVDIRGFTQLARQIDEELLAQAIGTWFREIGAVLDRSGCASDKYIGDAAMGVWVHENLIPGPAQILGVLNTLLMIQRFTAGLHERFPLPSQVQTGAGINTSISVMSNCGPQGNPDFSPLGDGVNAAFRLESATKDMGYDVAIGRLTFECLAASPNVVKYFERHFVRLKGYPQPLEAWLTSYEKLSQYLFEVGEKVP
jgi:adenylate cyclase